MYSGRHRRTGGGLMGMGDGPLLFLFLLLRLRVADRGGPTLGHALLLQALIRLRVLDRRALLFPWHGAPPKGNFDYNVYRHYQYNSLEGEAGSFRPVSPLRIRNLEFGRGGGP